MPANKQYCGDCGRDVTIAPERVEMVKENVRQNFQTLLAEADRETVEEVTRDVFRSAVDYIDRIEETD
ncbi:hypothetical protein ACEU6E_07060 [Halorutilales archaeon Cl-col2-1]